MKKSFINKLALRLLFVASLLLPSHAFSEGLMPIDELLAQRLSYMKDVAAYKWVNKLPIEDKQRERQVIDAAVKNGLRFRLTPASSQAFFELQITAAKEIQTYWFRLWQKTASTEPKSAPDLNQVIRPALIELGNKITTALGDSNTVSQHRFFSNKTLNLEIEGLSKQTASNLLSEVSRISQFDNRLDQILETGKIRIGTTGDYAPFTNDKSGSLAGIDIDMAKDLAASLGVELEWVETSWPNLMSDLAAGHFDIAMGGISKNLQRQRKAFFSSSYHVGGKAPIIRCRDAEKYKTIAQIDTANTRLIVNPGGTNHRYATENIKHAQLKIHDDNRTIFELIRSGDADVMITDVIEVRLQSGIYDDLCPAFENQLLTYSEKAYLLPRDLVWQAYVNNWLNIRSHDGKLTAVFKKYLD